MPPELAEQVPYMKEILDAMNIKRLEMEGFEADDIIGSVSKCAEGKNMQVVIVTGDRIRCSLHLTIPGHNPRDEIRQDRNRIL